MGLRCSLMTFLTLGLVENSGLVNQSVPEGVCLLVTGYQHPQRSGQQHGYIGSESQFKMKCHYIRSESQPKMRYHYIGSESQFKTKCHYFRSESQPKMRHHYIGSESQPKMRCPQFLCTCNVPTHLHHYSLDQFICLCRHNFFTPRIVKFGAC